MPTNVIMPALRAQELALIGEDESQRAVLFK
jgi:hypothetical protein